MVQKYLKGVLSMNRYQILIEYVGTNYSGWQIQRKGKTIQGKIQKVISKILKEKIIIIGSEGLILGYMLSNNQLTLIQI